MALNLLDRFKNSSDNPEMSFVDHLEALRWHIVRAVLAIMVIAIVVFIKMDWIFEKIIYGPLRPDFISYSASCKVSHFLHLGNVLCIPSIAGVKLQTTSFSSQFISSLTISLVGGFIVSFPYVFWEFWRFIKPALSNKESKNTRGAIFWVTFFFLLGIGFGYFLLAPFTFSFLANYKLGISAMIETKPTLDDYLDNMVEILIGAGLAFQLPIISNVLTRVRLISPKFLRTYRKYAYVAILIIAGIITPSPDWMSQTIVAVPLILLYELSIWVSVRVAKELKKKDEEWS